MAVNRETDSLQSRLLMRGFRLTQRLPGRWGRRALESAQWALNYNGARKTARRAFRFARQGRRDPLLVAPFGDGVMVVDPRDEEIGRSVYIRGEYERRYFATAVDYLRRSVGLAPERTTLVDVGANIGTTTVDALRQFGFRHAVSFEPDPRNVRLLRTNLLLNDLCDRATVVPAAASDTETVLTLVRHEANSGDSRVGTDPGASAGETVEAMRLDTALARHGVSPLEIGLLWIDVQGHEAYVLRGAPSVVAAGVPIVFEYGMLADTDLDDLEAMAKEHYTHIVDIRRLAANPNSTGAIFDSCDLPRLRDVYSTYDHTDLLLVRRS